MRRVIAGACLLGSLAASLDCRREENNAVQSFEFRGVIRPLFATSSACGGPHFRESSGFPASDALWMVDGQKVCLYWDRLSAVIASASAPSGTRNCDYCAAADPCGSGTTIPPGDVPRSKFPSVRLIEFPFPISDAREEKAAFGYVVGCPDTTFLFQNSFRFATPD